MIVENRRSIDISSEIHKQTSCKQCLNEPRTTNVLKNFYNSYADSTIVILIVKKKKRSFILLDIDLNLQLLFQIIVFWFTCLLFKMTIEKTRRGCIYPQSSILKGWSMPEKERHKDISILAVLWWKVQGGFHQSSARQNKMNKLSDTTKPSLNTTASEPENWQS